MSVAEQEHVTTLDKRTGSPATVRIFGCGNGRRHGNHLRVAVSQSVCQRSPQAESFSAPQWQVKFGFNEVAADDQHWIAREELNRAGGENVVDIGQFDFVNRLRAMHGDTTLFQNGHRGFYLAVQPP